MTGFEPSPQPRRVWRQKRRNGPTVEGPVVHLGFSDMDACDRCGEVTTTLWINGVGLEIPGLGMLVAHEFGLRPERITEFGIYLCYACVRVGLTRGAPSVPDPVRRATGAPDEQPGPMVYFIRSGPDGPIKIGTARDPSGRLAALQTGSPHLLVGLGVVSGGAEIEATFHARFSAHRLRGEWFAPHAEILACISEEASPWPTRSGVEVEAW